MSAEPQPVSSSPPATIASTTNNTNTNPVNSNIMSTANGNTPAPHNLLKRKTPPMASLEPDFARRPQSQLYSRPALRCRRTLANTRRGGLICEVCGGAVSFRDDNGAGGSAFHAQALGGSSVDMVAPNNIPDNTRLRTPHPHPHSHPNGAHGHSPTSVPGSAYTSPPTPSCSSDPNVHLGNMYASANGPPAKRRRAKRTEEERIEYLRADVHVAQFEAYPASSARAATNGSDSGRNSTYCSIPWDAHRKSCLAKKSNAKNIYALEERNATFQKDPDVRKFDAERIRGMCDKWLSIPVDDHPTAVQIWLHHRGTCQKTVSALKNVIANASAAAMAETEDRKPIIASPPSAGAGPSSSHRALRPASPGRGQTTLKRADPHLKATPTTPSPSRSPASGTFLPRPPALAPAPADAPPPPRRAATSSSTSRRPLTTPPRTNRAGAMPSSAPRLSARRPHPRGRAEPRLLQPMHQVGAAAAGQQLLRISVAAAIAGSVWHGNYLFSLPFASLVELMLTTSFCSQRRAQKANENRVPQGRQAPGSHRAWRGGRRPGTSPARMATSLSPRRALHRIHAATHNRSPQSPPPSRTSPARPPARPRAIPAGYAAASKQQQQYQHQHPQGDDVDAEGEADDVDADGDSYREEEGGQSLRVLRIWIRPADAAPSSSPPSTTSSAPPTRRAMTCPCRHLLTYLNAAMPTDKHEDFDTGEVARAAGALAAREKERYALEGDMLRLLSHESG
ncbi:hypothetical protein B0H14DRAFT_3143582 [Mycena olivaceomarginata]|nr:hypothetical protein B0H14DRAFT_3143582 [Mycena olivaceomarginata]